MPKDDPWDKRLPIEELRDWFAVNGTAHANWRKLALTECLARVARTRNAGDAEVRRFSQAFASFLQQQPNGPFAHKITGDRWGFIINTPHTLPHVQLAWKTGKGRVDLTFSGHHVGKARHVSTPPGISRQLADGMSLKSDILGIEVPMVDLSAPFEDQTDIVAEVMAAAWRLLPLVPRVLAVPAGQMATHTSK